MGHLERRCCVRHRVWMPAREAGVDHGIAVIHDVSVGGANVATPSELAVGSEIHLECITLLGTVVRARGCVVRCTRNRQDLGFWAYRSGVKFRDASWRTLLDAIEQSRGAILMAALSQCVKGRHGLGGLTFDRLAQVLGVESSEVGQYFENVEELRQSLATTVIQSVGEMAGREAAAIDEIEQSAATLARVYIGSLVRLSHWRGALVGSNRELLSELLELGARHLEALISGTIAHCPVRAHLAPELAGAIGDAARASCKDGLLLGGVEERLELVVRWILIGAAARPQLEVRHEYSVDVNS